MNLENTIQNYFKTGFARIAATLFSLTILGACGGGGGSTPAPSITMTFSQPKIAVGQSSTLTWSSTNATSCTASGAWTGAQATSGTATETAASGGAETYTLTCSGSGGQTTQSTTLAVPIPVQATSYLNKITAAAAIGPQPLPSEVASGNAVAFADFFQDGTYSMVTHSLLYNVNDPSTSTDYGQIYFYKNVNGTWVDHTADILSNTTGCLHPRKAIVSDFNGDGKPDVFFSCTGFDAATFPGEQSHVLLSQPDGTYKNVTLPYTAYAHGASAADFGGKGFADIVITDTSVQHTPYFLVNNGDGTFSQNFTRLPTVIPYGYGQIPLQAPASSCNGCNSNIYDAELIDLKNIGKYDLFLIGLAPDGTQGNWAPTIFHNNGDNTYSESNITTLPYNQQYQQALDVLFVNGVIYTTGVHVNDGATSTSSTPLYGFSDIEKDSGTNYQTNSTIWTGTSNFSNGWSWLNWIIPYQGNIDSLNSSYGVSVPQ